jgi:hypothetical protein
MKIAPNYNHFIVNGNEYERFTETWPYPLVKNGCEIITPHEYNQAFKEAQSQYFNQINSLK